MSGLFSVSDWTESLEMNVRLAVPFNSSEFASWGGGNTIKTVSVTYSKYDDDDEPSVSIKLRGCVNKDNGEPDGRRRSEATLRENVAVEYALAILVCETNNRNDIVDLLRKAHDRIHTEVYKMDGAPRDAREKATAAIKANAAAVTA